MKKIFLTIPGIHGSDDNHWQSLWEKRYRNFKRVNQINWDHPDASEWVKALDEKISRYPHHAIYLIAHSMGCHTVARWAAQSDRHVAGALLVAPGDPEREELRAVLKSWSPVVLQPLPFTSTLVGSAMSKPSSPIASSFGQPCVENGNIAEENQVSSTSGSWRSGASPRPCFCRTSASLRPT